MFAMIVSATPVDKRELCVYICGTVCYWQEDIDEAVTQGYNYYNYDTTVGVISIPA
jgi:hypothetical protein